MKTKPINRNEVLELAAMVCDARRHKFEKQGQKANPGSLERARLRGLGLESHQCAKAIRALKDDLG